MSTEEYERQARELTRAMNAITGGLDVSLYLARAQAEQASLLAELRSRIETHLTTSVLSTVARNSRAIKAATENS